MGYKNGKTALPPALLRSIQQYVSGESIYIPKAEKTPRRTSAQLDARNQDIRRKHAEGHSVRSLAGEYFLSPQAIYKILAERDK